MTFGFVANHRGIWPVQLLCKVVTLAVVFTPGSTGRPKLPARPRRHRASARMRRIPSTVRRVRVESSPQHFIVANESGSYRSRRPGRQAVVTKR